LTDVSEVLTACFIRAMMEAVITFETSVSFYETALRSIPEDSLFRHYAYFIYQEPGNGVEIPELKIPRKM
jgi:hypothetical protein